MNEERRKYDRISVRTIVRMQFDTIGEFMQSYAQNISVGGMKLAVAQSLDIGDPIAIEFKLKSDYPLIQGVAIVKWCEQSGDHYLVGVEFQEMDEHSQSTIQEAVKLQDDGAAPHAQEIDTSDLLAPPETESPEIEEISSSDLAAPELTPGELTTNEDADFGDLELDAPEAEPDIDHLELPNNELNSPEVESQESSDFGDLEMDIPSDDDVEEFEVATFEQPTADAGEFSEPEASEVPDLESIDFGDLTADLDSSENPVAAPTADDDVGALFEDTAVADEDVESVDYAPQAGSGPSQMDFGTGFDAEQTISDTDFADPTEISDPAAGNASGKRKILLLGVAVLLLGGGVAAWFLLGSDQDQPTVAQQQDDLPDIQPDRPLPQEPDGQAAQPVAQTAATQVAGGADAVTAMDNVKQHDDLQKPSDPEPAAQRQPEPKPAPKPDPKPKPKPEPVRTVAGEVSKILKLQSGQGDIWLVIKGDGSFEGKFKYFALSSPPRAVVDLLNVDIAADAGASMADQHGNVNKVRVGIHEDKVRIVLDLASDRGFELEPAGSQLRVRAK